MLTTLAAFAARDLYLVVMALAAAFAAFHFLPLISPGSRASSIPAGLPQRSDLVELAVAALFIAALSFLLAKAGSGLIASPRPFVVTGTPPLISSATDNGFPSDHTLLLAVVAALVTLVSRRAGLLFWGLALLVGLARVYAGVHHLIDITGSLAIASLALLLYLLCKRLWQVSHSG